MTNQYLANYCMDNPEHQMFRLTDGARCVECNGFVDIKEVARAVHYHLPTYQQARKQIQTGGEKEMQKVIQHLQETREGIHESIDFNHKEIAQLKDKLNERKAKVEELFKESAELTKAIETLGGR